MFKSIGDTVYYIENQVSYDEESETVTNVTKIRTGTVISKGWTKYIIQDSKTDLLECVSSSKVFYRKYSMNHILGIELEKAPNRYDR